MDQQLRVHDAVPDGFVVDSATVDGEKITFVLHSTASRVRCPLCGLTTNLRWSPSGGQFDKLGST